MKKTTGETEPTHKESKDSVVLFKTKSVFWYVSVLVFSLGCKYSSKRISAGVIDFIFLRDFVERRHLA